MQEIKREVLVNKASELLKNGTVDRVFGWKKGEFDYDITPALFTSAEDIEKEFVWGDFCGANFSKYLVKETGKSENKVLVFLKPCDTYSFNQLLTEHRFDREKVYAVGVPCAGMLDTGKIKSNAEGVAKVTDNGDKVIIETLFDGEITLDRNKLLPDRCLNCKSKKHVAYDELLGEDGVVLDSHRFDEVEKLEKMTELIKRGEKKKFPPIQLKSEIQPQFPKEKYCSMVEKAKHYIHEGDIFQVVLSNPMRAKAEGSLFDTYRVLRATNPSPYMFYFSSDDIEIAGASPETLVKLEHGKLSTFPLAGTRPRGKTPEEDKALEADLLQDEKELAEHNMLVDLGRNDIGKISELGSVKVEKYLTVERYSCVMHLGSTVTGTIKKGKDAIDAVDAILPAGTLSGAPKFRACQIIQELEKSKRGIYGGAIGYVDFTGNLDVCIAIRLVYKKKDEICIRSGAGIVADSVPEKEFEECQNKARAVVRAISQAQEGLE